MKSEIFNLIIIDESGSMCGIVPQTISGCNETINTIRYAQKKYADTQTHYVSIFAFQSNGSRPSRYLIKNAPVDQVRNITNEDYEPWGSTPLYDAVGSTLTDLRALTADRKMAIGSVTIITDGMENSSCQYSLQKVASMIEALKEQGWSFNFIGANIDVNAAAASLKIDNAMEFRQDSEGTKEMFEKEKRSRMGWLRRTHEATCSFKERAQYSPSCSEPDERYREEMRKAAEKYFDDERGADVDEK